MSRAQCLLSTMLLGWLVVWASDDMALAQAQPKPQPGFEGFGATVPAPQLPPVDLGLAGLGLGAAVGPTGMLDPQGLGVNLGLLLGLLAQANSAAPVGPQAGAEAGGLAGLAGPDLLATLGALLGGQAGGAQGDAPGPLGQLGGLLNINALMTLLKAYQAGAADDPEAILDQAEELDKLKEGAGAVNLEGLMALLQLLAGAQGRLGEGQGDAGALGGLLGGLGGLGTLGGLLGGLGGDEDGDTGPLGVPKPRTAGDKAAPTLQLEELLKALGQGQAPGLQPAKTDKPTTKPADQPKTK